MPKSLADGHVKFTLLLTKPVDPAAPTATELNAGIDMECNVLNSDFAFGPTDSDKIAEKALCDLSNKNAIGASNYTAGFTVFRKFDSATGAVDDTEDEAFQAVKVKGTTVWGYVRKTGKVATLPWAAGDEIWNGQEILTDTPQSPSDAGGYIKARVPAESQAGWDFVEVAAGI